MNPQKYGLIKGLINHWFHGFSGGGSVGIGWPVDQPSARRALVAYPSGWRTLRPKNHGCDRGGGQVFPGWARFKGFSETQDFKFSRGLPKWHDIWYIYIIYKMSGHLSGWYTCTHTHNFTCFKWTLKVSGQWCRDIVIRHWLFRFLTPQHGDMWSFILLAGPWVWAQLIHAYPCILSYQKRLDHSPCCLVQRVDEDFWGVRPWESRDIKPNRMVPPCSFKGMVYAGKVWECGHKGLVTKIGEELHKPEFLPKVNERTLLHHSDTLLEEQLFECSLSNNEKDVACTLDTTECKLPH